MNVPDVSSPKANHLKSIEIPTKSCKTSNPNRNVPSRWPKTAASSTTYKNSSTSSVSKPSSLTCTSNRQRPCILTRLDPRIRAVCMLRVTPISRPQRKTPATPDYMWMTMGTWFWTLRGRRKKGRNRWGERKGRDWVDRNCIPSSPALIVRNSSSQVRQRTSLKMSVWLGGVRREGRELVSIRIRHSISYYPRE